MRRFKDPYLLMYIGGRLHSRTLCTSNVHANNIIRDLIMQWDPFQRR